MTEVAVALTLVGVVLSTIGAAWLVFGFKPTNPRYFDEGEELLVGPQRSRSVPNLLADQRRPLGFVAAGGGVQVLGGVLSLVAM